MKKNIIITIILLVFLINIILTGCFQEEKVTDQNQLLSDVSFGDMKINSSSFNDSEYIPKKYTKYGMDITPPLSINDFPNSTKSFVLIMDDFDADNFVHWLVWNIPANDTGFFENETITYPQGLNDFDEIGYGGPKPPSKSGVHNYRFILYALNVKDIDLKKGSTRGELESLIDEKGYAIEKAVLMCKYKKN
jgi:Raf kinase inhibitor-like YbhB/YbcL family protein